LWYVYVVRHKIPFAAAMLNGQIISLAHTESGMRFGCGERCAGSISSQPWVLLCCVVLHCAVSLQSMSMFKSSWLLPIWGMILMSGLAFVWSVCAMSIVYAVDNGSSDGPRSVRGLIFFILVLSLFWTILTIKGWVHTCVAGVQATWSVFTLQLHGGRCGCQIPIFVLRSLRRYCSCAYIHPLSFYAVFALSSLPLPCPLCRYFLAPHALPSSPVWHAVKRASTTSFGSICFGAFIVAFIRTVRSVMWKL
jgi:hypothetical protein